MPSFQYQIIRSKTALSNVSIRISPEKGVIVRAPFWMPKALIDNFVKEKQSWVEKHLQNIGQKKVVKKYESGEKHLFFGQEYTLKIDNVPVLGHHSVQIIEDVIQVSIYKNSPTKVKDVLLHWYLEKGIEVITDRVNHYSDKIGVTYSRISLKNVSSIWGSCSPSNCLSFNRKLVMAPPQIVDYVIIHEVSHMVHRNHSRRFWELVSLHDPLYKSHRRWLKLNHHLLTI